MPMMNGPRSLGWDRLGRERGGFGEVKGGGGWRHLQFRRIEQDQSLVFGGAWQWSRHGITVRRLDVDAAHSLEALGERLHVLLDATRGDMVALIKACLNLAAAVGLINSTLHGFGDGIGIHNHTALYMAGSTTDDLDQRTF